MKKINLSRPTVLSIAGLDPSGGAGLLADIKTLEANGVYGVGVCSAITVQNDVEFRSLEWVHFDLIKAQIEILFSRMSIEVAKIGIIENSLVLKNIIDCLRQANPNIKIILDPVLSASTGFDFQSNEFSTAIKTLYKNIFLLTPNAEEVLKLTGQSNIEEGAKKISEHCAVLLKGGHRTDKKGEDVLWKKGKEVAVFAPNKIAESGKHGSGCVLSSAIAANISKGINIKEACKKGKAYTEDFLNSTTSLLGYHKK